MLGFSLRISLHTAGVLEQVVPSGSDNSRVVAGDEIVGLNREVLAGLRVRTHRSTEQRFIGLN